MKKFYFTFGQSHVHRVNGKTFDADTVVEIEAEDESKARDIMFEHFGAVWSMQYSEMPDMKYFPRGVIPLTGAKGQDAEGNEPNLKWYLGDGVWADYDGYHVVLTTEGNTIYLDPQVVEAFDAWRNLQLATFIKQEEANADTGQKT